MKVYRETDKYTIYNGDSMEMLSVIAPSSVDCIITDPPYELGFMNNKWDKQGIAFNVEFWKKCLQVLKPGGYLLTFGGSKTFHRMAVAIEDSGFEIRDMLMWLYSTGFPKGQDIGLAVDRLRGVPSEVVGRKKGATGTIKGDPNKVEFISNNQYEDGTHDILVAQNEWKGYNTSLKPAYEPIIMARKPVEGTVAQNVVKYGVGGGLILMKHGLDIKQLNPKNNTMNGKIHRLSTTSISEKKLLTDVIHRMLFLTAHLKLTVSSRWLTAIVLVGASIRLKRTIKIGTRA